MANAMLQKSFITAQIVRSMLYGLYFASLLLCLRSLLFEHRAKRLRENIDRRAVSIAIFIFCGMTTALAIASRITLDLVLSDSHSGLLSIIKVCSQKDSLPSSAKLSFNRSASRTV